MKDFNIIATTRRFAEEEAEDELLDLLESFGDSEAFTEITNVTGLIECRTSMDPFKVVSRLVDSVRIEPWIVRYLLRVVPIEAVVNADVEAIASCASRLASKILEGDAYRITVEKRHTTLESMNVISQVADKIKHKVDLEQPDWTVLVEIVGEEAGVSVLRQGELFSSVIEKRR